MNAWLRKEGLLRFDKDTEAKIVDYREDSICYSLIPGRIFVNLKGREPKGSVEKGDYEKTRQFIKEKLSALEAQAGEKVIENVFFREDIYNGPYLENAADIIAHPARGYDLKSGRADLNIFDSSNRNGMHTYDDAFVLGINFDLDPIDSIQDVKETIMR